MLISLKDHLVKTTAIGLLLGSASLAAPAKAESSLEGNIGFTSNYVWRGMTQTDDQAAISGGLDFSAGGFYAGTWVSNVDFGNDVNSEQDVYFGYAGDAGDFSYDVGYIAYLYSGAAGDADFSEVYVSVGAAGFSLTYSYLVDADYDSDSGDQTYISLDYELPLSGDFGVSLHYGIYDWEDAADTGSDEQTDFGMTISKDDFSLTLSQVDDEFFANDEDMKIFVSYGIGF
tara:strand:- start:1133 stop:1822 length:690 start_codon:yes stop_codon:yes gene_type:complete